MGWLKINQKWSVVVVGMRIMALKSLCLVGVVGWAKMRSGTNHYVGDSYIVVRMAVLEEKPLYGY